MPAVLVIGYGNALRADDGVGVRAAELLMADDRLAGCRILASHQLTPELALDMSRVSLVILIDADVRAEPGAIVIGRPQASTPGVSSRPEPGASSHHVGVGELLALAGQLGGEVPEAVVIGVGIEDVEYGESLSPAVEAALPTVVDAVAGLVEEHRAGEASEG